MRLIFLALLSLTTLPPGSAQARDIILFAAASTTHVLGEIGKSRNAREKDRIRVVYGSSGALARQIANGAPADIFFSANKKWIDYLETGKHTRPDTRHTVFRNRIVLIAPTDNRTPSPFDPTADIVPLLAGDGRLAIGDPQHVPAGIYARQALSALGLWDRLADRTVRTRNVRLALALVQRKEAVLGIVYHTDAIQTDRVRIVMTFDSSLHAPILYDAVAMNSASRGAIEFLAYLKSEEAGKIYRKHGFLTR